MWKKKCENEPHEYISLVFIKQKTNAEVAIGGVPWKKLFLKISQHSQENTCVGVSF